MIEITTQHPNLGIIKQFPTTSRRQAANVTYAKNRDFEIQFTVVSRAENNEPNGICTVSKRRRGGEYLVGVYVLPSKRRQGIGQELVNAALAEALRRGWTVIGEAITPEGLALIKSVPGLTVRATGYAEVANVSFTKGKKC